MKHARKTLVIAAVAATLVASPAFAWTCKAKNDRGATYFGVGVFKVAAVDRALVKCRLNSLVPATCVIVDCVP